MSLLAATVLGVLLSGQSQAQDWKPNNYYATLFPRPTHANGYEEFMMAADLLDGPRFEAIIQRQYERSLPRLETAEAADRGFSRVADLVRQGLQKEVVRPEIMDSGERLFPELGGLRRVGRFLSLRMYAQAARGNTKESVQCYLDTLELSQKCSGSNLITLLIGRASEAIAHGTLEETLFSYSCEDAKLLQARLKPMIESVEHIRRAIAGEAQGIVGELDRMFAKGKDSILATIESYMIEDDPGSLAAFKAWLAKATPADLTLLRQGIRKSFSEHFAKFDELLEKPESEWVSSASLPQFKGLEEERIVFDLFLPIFDQVLRGLAVGRTQLRLAWLHAKILEYRWTWGRLPASLKEAGAAESEKDPLSGDLFQYEFTSETSYRLYSKGFGPISRVELRYRPPSSGTVEPRPPRTAHGRSLPTSSE